MVLCACADDDAIVFGWEIVLMGVKAVRCDASHPADLNASATLHIIPPQTLQTAASAKR